MSGHRDSYVLMTLAPFLDYYPNPRDGLHLELGVGFGVLVGCESIPAILQ